MKYSVHSIRIDRSNLLGGYICGLLLNITTERSIRVYYWMAQSRLGTVAWYASVTDYSVVDCYSTNNSSHAVNYMSVEELPTYV